MLLLGDNALNTNIKFHHQFVSPVNRLTIHIFFIYVTVNNAYCVLIKTKYHWKKGHFKKVILYNQELSSFTHDKTNLQRLLHNSGMVVKRMENAPIKAKNESNSLLIASFLQLFNAFHELYKGLLYNFKLLISK
jgi:hypothetical protein